MPVAEANEESKADIFQMIKKSRSHLPVYMPIKRVTNPWLTRPDKISGDELLPETEV